MTHEGGGQNAHVHTRTQRGLVTTSNRKQDYIEISAMLLPPPSSLN